MLGGGGSADGTGRPPPSAELDAAVVALATGAAAAVALATGAAGNGELAPLDASCARKATISASRAARAARNCSFVSLPLALGWSLLGMSADDDGKSGLLALGVAPGDATGGPLAGVAGAGGVVCRVGLAGGERWRGREGSPM